MKHLKYLRYVLKHRWYVFVECCRMGIPVRGLLHDLSKFFPDEWFAYVNWFYGKYGVKFKSGYPWEFDKNRAVKKAFDKAWLKHIHRNPHHWQWWILNMDAGNEVIIPMNKRYRTEMLADWVGAGRAITGKREIVEWYDKNRDRIKLCDADGEWIDIQMVKEKRPNTGK